MMEVFVLLVISVILTLTILGFIVMLFITTTLNIHIIKKIIIAIICVFVLVMNFKYITSSEISDYRTTYEKEDIIKNFKEVEINGIKYIFNDDTSIRIDYNNYYKLLCDDYSLNVYQDRILNQIYFYKQSDTIGNIYGKVDCREQKILKGE